MNKKIPLVAGIAIVAIIVALVYSYSTDPFADDNEGKPHDAIWSGPVGVTQYEHRLGDDVFLLVRNLQPHESGTIHVYTPQGVLFKTISYNGAIKSDFNQYFYPDTIAALNICTPEELVGIWDIVFEGAEYPTLQFEMTDKWVEGAEASITVVC